MQKRKIEDSKIFEAYSRLIAGESLTKVASSEEINLDRGTLKKYIEIVVIPTLSSEEKERFEQLMNGNFKGNHTGNTRKNRNQKKKTSEEELADSIKVLADLGVTANQVESLYLLLRGNKHTAYARDTFTYKCVEHFTFFNQIGISTQDAFDMFMRNPRAFTSDTRALQERYAYFLRKTKSREEAREALLRNPRGKNKDLAVDDYRKEQNTFPKTLNLVDDTEIDIKTDDDGRGED